MKQFLKQLQMLRFSSEKHKITAPQTPDLAQH